MTAAPAVSGLPPISQQNDQDPQYKVPNVADNVVEGNDGAGTISRPDWVTAQRIVVAYVLVATEVQQLWGKEEGRGGGGGGGGEERTGVGGGRGRGEQGRSLRVRIYKY